MDINSLALLIVKNQESNNKIDELKLEKEKAYTSAISLTTIMIDLLNENKDELDKLKNIIITTFNDAFNKLKVGDYVYFKHRLDSDKVAIWTKLKIVLLDRKNCIIVFDNDTLSKYTSLQIYNAVWPIDQRFVPIIDNNILTEKMIKILSGDDSLVDTHYFLNKSEYITVDVSK